MSKNNKHISFLEEAYMADIEGSSLSFPGVGGIVNWRGDDKKVPYSLEHDDLEKIKKLIAGDGNSTKKEKIEESYFFGTGTGMNDSNDSPFDINMDDLNEEVLGSDYSPISMLEGEDEYSILSSLLEEVVIDDDVEDEDSDVSPDSVEALSDEPGEEDEYSDDSYESPEMDDSDDEALDMLDAENDADEIPADDVEGDGGEIGRLEDLEDSDIDELKDLINKLASDHEAEEEAEGQEPDGDEDDEEEGGEESPETVEGEEEDYEDDDDDKLDDIAKKITESFYGELD